MLQLLVIIGFVAALIIRLRSRHPGTKPDSDDPKLKKRQRYDDPAYRYIPKQKHNTPSTETGMVREPSPNSAMIDWEQVWISAGFVAIVGTLMIIADGVAGYWQPWVVLAICTLAFGMMGLGLSFPNNSKVQRYLSLLCVGLLILAAVLPTIFEHW